MKLFEDDDLQDQMDYRLGICHALLRIDFDEVGEELKEMDCLPLPPSPPPPPPLPACTFKPHGDFGLSASQAPLQSQAHSVMPFTFRPDATMHSAHPVRLHPPTLLWSQHGVEIEMLRRAQSGRSNLRNWSYGQSPPHWF
jgi:hypothetical protein